MKTLHTSLVLLVGLFISTNIFAQNSTINKGDWNTNSNWSTGTAPNTTLGSGTININNRTILEGDITFLANGNTVINVTDTLIIVGNVIYQSNAGNNKINISGVLIITGSLNSAGSVNIDVLDNDGILIVAGDLNYNGGNPKGDANAEFYVNGTLNPPYSDSRWTNPGSPGSTGVQGDFTHLQTNHPILFNIVNNPLPIELRYFDAAINDNFFEFKWETITEENNDYFTIEYSFDLVTFNMLLEKQGAGNSLIPILYEDGLPVFPFENIIYFRLKQTDFDGNYSYSSIEALSNSGLKKSALSIYPNPTKGRTLVKLENVNETPLEAKVISPSTLQTVNTFYLVNGEAIVDFSNFEKGVYFLQIENVLTPYKLVVQ